MGLRSRRTMKHTEAHPFAGVGEKVTYTPAPRRTENVTTKRRNHALKKARRETSGNDGPLRLRKADRRYGKKKLPARRQPITRWGSSCGSAGTPQARIPPRGSSARP